MSKTAETIDEVILHLDEIISHHAAENSALCLFPTLYRKVTVAVRDKIKAGNYFEDNARMEKLDVIFANRYIEAWNSRRKNEPLSECWKFSFEAPGKFRLLILQHLLLGMNAHINLDLGIAAHKAAGTDSIHVLKTDFMRINDILGGLMDAVQAEVAKFSPWLGVIDRVGGRMDERIFGFSMKRARDFSWLLAIELHSFPGKDIELIHKRDGISLALARKSAQPGFWLGLAIQIASWREESDYSKISKALY